MKKTLISLIVWIFTFNAYGQAVWMTPHISTDSIFLLDETNNISWASSEVLPLVNYNPVFSVEKAYFLDVSKIESSGLSLFVVSQMGPASQEQHILSLYSGNSDIAILTDRRMADFQKGRFANFLDYDPKELKLSSFTKSSLLDENFTIKVAGQAQRKDLPLIPASGFIGDLILYPSAVSPMTKEIIESTLALKYGLSLSPFSKYRDRNGKLLLDLGNTEFKHQVGGIGKITSLNLDQKQSITTIEKGTLSIAMNTLQDSNHSNPSKLIENNFLIWSDNHASIDFQTRSNGNKKIDRTWQLINTGVSETNLFQFKIDEPVLRNQLQENEILWLGITSESENNYYPLNRDDLSTHLTINPGIHNMSIYQAAESWVAVNTESASCDNGELGAAHIQLLGNITKPGFKIIDENGSVIYNQQSISEALSISALESGKYTVYVFENERPIINHTFYINDSDLEKIELPTNISVDHQRGYSFDASQFTSQNYSYRWVLPDGESSEGPRIRFTKDGTYILTISSESCKSSFPIEVSISDEAFKDFIVYPNPSSTGHIWWEIEQNSERPLEILVTDILGSQIFSRKYDASLFEKGYFIYPHNGTIFITAKSGKTIQTETVIIQNL